MATAHGTGLVPKPLPMTPLEALTLLYSGLAQQGPGGDATTLVALRQLLGEPPSAWIAQRSGRREPPVALDLGCGAGRQTLVLAQALATPIVAVDQQQVFLKELAARAAGAGLAPWVKTLVADIGRLAMRDGTVDLVWSEGAAYSIGFDHALRTWSALLRPGGRMAVSECTWLVDEPPDEPREFWNAAYPAMRTASANMTAARAEGLSVIGHFTLPRECWWENYYVPLIERIERLEPAGDATLAAVLAETRREIDLYRRYGDTYGYEFYLLEKPAG